MRSLATHPAPLLATLLAACLTLPPASAGACPSPADAKTAGSSACATKATTACVTDAKAAQACPVMSNGCCASRTTATNAAVKSKPGARAAKTARTVKAATAKAVTPKPAAPAAAPATAGMRVAIDPETGALVPAGPDAATEQSAIIGTPTFQAQRLADGSLMIDLQGQLEEYMLLQVGPDGRRVVRCVEDPKKAMSTPPAPAPQPEER